MFGKTILNNDNSDRQPSQDRMVDGRVSALTTVWASHRFRFRRLARVTRIAW